MPGEFKDILSVLLYLLPGFLARELYRAKYPAKKVSDFEMITWSVLHSFVIHLLLAAASHVPYFPDLRFRTYPSGFPDDQSIAFLLLAGVAWGGILRGRYWLWAQLPFLPTPDSLTIWPQVAVGCPREELWAFVRLRNGPNYLGWIDRFSFDPSQADQDFYLSPAFIVSDDLTTQTRPNTVGVYLNTRDIQAIEFLPGRRD